MNRHERRERDRHREERARSEKPKRASRWPYFLVIGAGIFVSVVVLRSENRSNNVVTSPGPVKLAKLSANELQKTSELNGFDGGAKAGQTALAGAEKVKPVAPQTGTVFIVAPFAESTSTDQNVTATKADPQHPQAAIRIVGIRSENPHVNRNDSIQDAHRVARQRLAEVLQSLDPPIQVLPSDSQIASDYVVANSAKDIPASEEIRDAWKAGGVDPNRQWATVDIEVSESQLRTLRAKQRLIELGWILGGIFGVLGLGYGVLKLDALAKNYLMKRAVPAPAVV